MIFMLDILKEVVLSVEEVLPVVTWDSVIFKTSKKKVLFCRHIFFKEKDVCSNLSEKVIFLFMAVFTIKAPTSVVVLLFESF